MKAPMSKEAAAAFAKANIAPKRENYDTCGKCGGTGEEGCPNGYSCKHTCSHCSGSGRIYKLNRPSRWWHL